MTEGTETKGTLTERREIRGTVAGIEKVTVTETGKTHSGDKDREDSDRVREETDNRI